MGPLREVQEGGRRGGAGGEHGKMIKGREEGRKRKAVDTDTDTSCRPDRNKLRLGCPSASIPRANSLIPLIGLAGRRLANPLSRLRADQSARARGPR